MSDCRFGVSPVNYPDPDPDPIVNIRPSDGRWIDFSNACRNVPPAWAETSYSYSDVHVTIRRFPQDTVYVPIELRVYSFEL